VFHAWCCETIGKIAGCINDPIELLKAVKHLSSFLQPCHFQPQEESSTSPDPKAPNSEKIQFLHSTIMTHTLQLLPPTAGILLPPPQNLTITTESRVKEMQTKFEIYRWCNKWLGNFKTIYLNMEWNMKRVGF
jgi:hypothetical protein